MINSIQSSAHGTRIALAGTLDADGAFALRSSLEQIVTGAIRNVTFDLGDVSYMDGSGVGALAFTFKRLAARGLELRVEGAHGQPLSLLRKLGLDRTLGIAPATPQRRLGLAAALGLARAA